MTCEASLLTGLIEYWPFDEAGGVVAHGAKGVLDLDLRRGTRAVELGWPAAGQHDGAGRCFYAGGGSGLLPGSVPPLADDAGEAITIAVRWWPAAHRFCLDPVANASQSDYFLSTGQTINSYTKRVGGRMIAMVAGMELFGGNWTTNSYVDDSGNWQVVGAPITVPGVPVAGDSIAPWLHLVVARRTGPQAGNGETWIDGVQVDTHTVSGGPPDTEWGPAVGFGDTYFDNQGGVVQAAIWSRALTQTEIESLGDSLDCLGSLLDGDEDAGEGTDNPLLHPDGTPRLRYEWPAPRSSAPSALAAEGPHRHTAALRQREARRYTLTVNNATAAEAEILRELLSVTAHGGRATRWRSHDDPAGLVKDAPYYRLANPGPLAQQLRRRAGGAVGDFVIELERVF